MSDVVMLGMFSSSSDEMAFSSSERAVVGSHRIFSLEKHFNYNFKEQCASTLTLSNTTGFLRIFWLPPVVRYT